MASHKTRPRRGRSPSVVQILSTDSAAQLPNSLRLQSRSHPNQRRRQHSSRTMRPKHEALQRDRRTPVRTDGTPGSFLKQRNTLKFRKETIRCEHQACRATTLASWAPFVSSLSSLSPWTTPHFILPHVSNYLLLTLPFPTIHPPPTPPLPSSP